MKKFLITIIFGQIYLNLLSQIQPNYRTYVKGNKLYFNKKLPVYFWISTDSVNTQQDELLTSEVSAKYSNPMYFDTQGYNTFQCNTTDKKPKGISKNTTYKIYADDYPSSLEVNFKGSLMSNSPKTYKKGLQIVAKSKDYTSGVFAIFYSLNNSDFIVYNSPIVFENAGEYFLKIYAEDNTGNISETKTYKFVVK